MDNFVTLFEKTIKDNWHLPAIAVVPGKTISYQELAESIGRLERFWKKMGLKEGDKVAIFAANSAEWLQVYLAAILCGYVAVLLPKNGTLEQQRECLVHSESKLLYTDEEHFWDSPFDSSQRTVAVFDIRNNGIICTSMPQLPSLDGREIERHFVDNQSVCTIMYTSGSSGRPKGVQLTMGNISYNVRTACRAFPYLASDSHVNMLPFTHIYGLMCDALAPLCLGRRVVVVQSSYHIPSLCSVICDFNPSVFFTIPIVVEKMVEPLTEAHSYSEEQISDRLKKIFGARLRLLVTGGSPVSQETESYLINVLKLPFVSGYGITECGPISVGEAFRYKKKSCGKLLDKSVVRINSSDPQALPGEIQVKGDNVFAGYFNDSEATASVFSDDGWFRTGDMGVIDGEDNLFLLGRCKDMLLTSNGENIYPDDIEKVMNACPYVDESILVQRGERLHAIIVPDRIRAKADNLDEAALMEVIKTAVLDAGKHLPGFAVINSYSVTDTPLERTAKGGLKRYLYS